MTGRPLPPQLPGICDTCGYPHNPSEPCATYPCHRCIHRQPFPPLGPGGTMNIPPAPYPPRDDGSPGYTPTDYLNCPCGCHNHWRNLYTTHSHHPAITTTHSEHTTQTTHKRRTNAQTHQPHPDDWT